MNSETTLTASSKMLFTPPAAQWYIGVSLGEWNALRNKIERIYSGSRLLAFVGPFLWGAAASFFSTAVLSGKSVAPWIAFATISICAVMWLIVSHKDREVSAWTKEDVLGEMDRLQAAWIPSQKSSTKRPPLVLTES